MGWRLAQVVEILGLPLLPSLHTRRTLCHKCKGSVHGLYLQQCLAHNTLLIKDAMKVSL